MRVLLDESVPIGFAALLESEGHDVLAIAVFSPSIADNEVWRIAKREKRTLVTYDKDFGRIASEDAGDPHSGVVLIRHRPPPELESDRALINLLAQPVSWEHTFAVIDRNTVRIRQLPAPR